MFTKIPIILTADQLFDRAIRKSKKIQIIDKSPQIKIKKTIIARIDSFSSVIISSLENYVKKFPSIDNLPTFYQELIDIRIDINKLKKSLGAVDWAKKTCYMIYSKQVKTLKKTGNIEFLKQKQKEIYGRISSVVKQIDGYLIFLANAQNIMNKFPDIRDIPTVVIAGYPNVGKSSLLRIISSAKPKIANYPFTTTKIHVGHIEKIEKYIIKRYQIIDTPGLLDKPFSNRNNIEKQAIAALRHLADLIVFVFDPTETCGYSIKHQLNMLSQIKEIFKETPLIVLENKADLKISQSDNLKISCVNKSGIDDFMNKLFRILERI
jgi:nucleolar GTP-binding protein